jgi:CoA:oxalate CoA-transferase
MSIKPLSGVRMLCIEQLMALPFGTQLLADMGADVLCVEALDYAGDEAIPWRERTGRHKRRLAINLKDRRGAELVRRLAAEMDVFAENFRPGVMTRYGLDHAQLSAINERLIYVSVSGYGHDDIFHSPFSHMAAYGPIGEAMSGITHAIRAGGGAGSLRLALGDIVSSIYAAMGILAALRHRDLTGQGQRVDISMADALLTIGELPVVAAQLAAQGNHSQRGLANYPIGTFPTADGDIILIVLTEVHWTSLCRLLGREDWLSDSRFTDPGRRQDALNNEALPALRAWTGARTKQEAANEARAAGLAAAPVNGPEDILAEEHYRARDMLTSVITPSGMPLRIVGNPIKLSAVETGETPAPLQLAAPGADTFDVLGETLGLSGAELDGLVADGIIGGPR